MVASTQTSLWLKKSGIVAFFFLFAAEEFYSIIIESLLDNNYGIVEFLETEIDDELKSLQKYKDWDCDIVIVSTGQFFPYIEDGSNMMLDDFRLREMFVRNYDEGDID